VDGDHSLPDAIEVDANVHRAWRGRRRLRWRWRAFRGGRPRWRLVTSLWEQRRRLGSGQHGEINRPAHRTIDRTHLQPAGAGSVVRAGHEIKILATRVECRRDRIRQAISDLMRVLFSHRINEN